MSRSLKEIAELVQVRLLGDGDIQIKNIASIQSAKAGDLVFVEDEKNLPKALQSQATAVRSSLHSAIVCQSHGAVA